MKKNFLYLIITVSTSLIISYPLQSIGAPRLPHQSHISTPSSSPSVYTGSNHHDNQKHLSHEHSLENRYSRNIDDDDLVLYNDEEMRTEGPGIANKDVQPIIADDFATNSMAQAMEEELDQQTQKPENPSSTINKKGRTVTTSDNTIYKKNYSIDLNKLLSLPDLALSTILKKLTEDDENDDHEHISNKKAILRSNKQLREFGKSFGFYGFANIGNLTSPIHDESLCRYLEQHPEKWMEIKKLYITPLVFESCKIDQKNIPNIEVLMIVYPKKMVEFEENDVQDEGGLWFPDQPMIEYDEFDEEGESEDNGDGMLPSLFNLKEEDIFSKRVENKVKDAWNFYGHDFKEVNHDGSFKNFKKGHGNEEDKGHPRGSGNKASIYRYHRDKLESDDDADDPMEEDVPNHHDFDMIEGIDMEDLQNGVANLNVDDNNNIQDNNDAGENQQDNYEMMETIRLWEHLKNAFKTLKSLDIIDEHERSILHNVIVSKSFDDARHRLDTFKTILESKLALTDHQDVNGNAPLHYCPIPTILRVSMNQFMSAKTCVEMLLSQNANPYTFNQRKFTPAHVASVIPFSQPLHPFFDDYHVDINFHFTYFSNGQWVHHSSVLHSAVTFSDPNLFYIGGMDELNRLIGYESQLALDFVTEDVQWESWNDSIEVQQQHLKHPILYLVEKGIDLFISMPFTGTAFLEAISRNDELLNNIIIHILRTKNSKEIPLNLGNFNGKKPLHFAAENKNLELVTALLDAGARIGEVCDSGMNALHYAIYAEAYIEIIQLLVHHGIDVNSKHDTGVGIMKYLSQSVSTVEYSIRVLNILLNRGFKFYPDLSIGTNREEEESFDWVPFLHQLYRLYRRSLRSSYSNAENSEILLLRTLILILPDYSHLENLNGVAIIGFHRLFLIAHKLHEEKLVERVRIRIPSWVIEDMSYDKKMIFGPLFQSGRQNVYRVIDGHNSVALYTCNMFKDAPEMFDLVNTVKNVHYDFFVTGCNLFKAKNIGHLTLGKDLVIVNKKEAKLKLQEFIERLSLLEDVTLITLDGRQIGWSKNISY